MTQGGIVPKATNDSVHSIIYHIFAAMILSLLYGVGWACGFVASSDVERDAYLTTQYLFSFLILTHTLLQFVLYLPPRKELSRLWHRTRGYDVNEAGTDQGGNSSKYQVSPNDEGIKLEESEHHSAKKPLTMGETAAVADKTVTSGPANPITDDKEAVTSYTNKEAVDGYDTENEKNITKL